MTVTSSTSRSSTPRTARSLARSTPTAHRPRTDSPGRRPSGVRPATVPGEAEHDEPDEVEILPVLTNTMVETPDLVAVFASVGHEALWANDAFVTLVPIRQADKVWLVELLDEWSKGHYEVKVLPALVKYGRWRGRLTLLERRRRLAARVRRHRGSPRPTRRHRRRVDGGARSHRAPPGRGACFGHRDPFRGARRARERHHRRARQRRCDPVRQPGDCQRCSAIARVRSTARTCSHSIHPEDKPDQPARPRAARRARRRLTHRDCD